jgi:hypothetical protein
MFDPKSYLTFFVKEVYDLKVFVHSAGEEFWINAQETVS